MMWRNATLILLSMLICRGVTAQQGEQPSMEFLEFLGEWENEQGEWVEPVDDVDEEERGNPASLREEEVDYEN